MRVDCLSLGALLEARLSLPLALKAEVQAVRVRASLAPGRLLCDPVSLCRGLLLLLVVEVRPYLRSVRGVSVSSAALPPANCLDALLWGFAWSASAFLLHHWLIDISEGQRLVAKRLLSYWRLPISCGGASHELASDLGLVRTRRLTRLVLHRLVLLHGVLIGRVVVLTVDAFLTLRLLVLQSRVGERLAHVYTFTLASSTIVGQVAGGVFVLVGWTPLCQTELLHLPWLYVERVFTCHWNFHVIFVSVVLLVVVASVLG